jgi:hypothetical protein
MSERRDKESATMDMWVSSAYPTDSRFKAIAKQRFG